MTSLHCTWSAGQEVLHVHRHGLGEVGHAPKAATGGTVIQQPAYSCGRVPLQDVFLCSEVPLERQKKQNFLSSLTAKPLTPDLPSSDAHLILEEHVVGLVDDFLHMYDGADAWDLHVSQHGEHQDGLHQQLPVLGLRDTVQHRLHVDGELNLSRRHLEGKPELEKHRDSVV